MKWNPFFFFLRQSYIQYRIHNLLEEGNFSHLEDRYDDSFDLTITCLNGARKHRLLVPSPRGEYDFDPWNVFNLVPSSASPLKRDVTRGRAAWTSETKRTRFAVPINISTVERRKTKEKGKKKEGKRERERGGKKEITEFPLHQGYSHWLSWAFTFPA